jgi:uncharacterized membrane-anchored protein
MNIKRLSIAIIIFQLLFLSLMIQFHNAKLAVATKILLRTIPYDPISPFRGNFAVLRYEISSLPTALLKDINPKQLKDGDELFVELKNNGNHWEAEGIYKKSPGKFSGVYLRCRLKYYYFRSDYAGDLNLEYGIESFFLNEDLAKEVDRANLRPGMDWREREKQKQERINQLDEEIKRINKAGIKEWWVKTLNSELEIWLKQKIIDQKTKDILTAKYSLALEKIAEIDKTLSSQTSAQQPITVEVAIDQEGYGHAVRLFVGAKEYR